MRITKKCVNSQVVADEDIVLGGKNRGVSFDRVMELGELLGFVTMKDMTNYYEKHKEGAETIFDTLLRCLMQKRAADEIPSIPLGGELADLAGEIGITNLRQLSRFLNKYGKKYEPATVTLRNFIDDTLAREAASTTEGLAKSKLSFARKSSVTEEAELFLSIQAQSFLAEHHEFTEQVRKFEEFWECSKQITASKSLCDFLLRNVSKHVQNKSFEREGRGHRGYTMMYGDTDGADFEYDVASIDYDVENGKLVLLVAINGGTTITLSSRYDVDAWDECELEVTGGGDFTVELPADVTDTDDYLFDDCYVEID